MTRLFKVTYMEEGDEEQYEAVIAEWMLPLVTILSEIEYVGDLMDGYSVTEDVDPEPKDKEPIPLKTGTSK